MAKTTDTSAAPAGAVLIHEASDGTRRPLGVFEGTAAERAQYVASYVAAHGGRIIIEEGAR